MALSWRPQSQALIQGAAGPELGTEHARAEVGPGSVVAMYDQPPGGHLEWQGRAWRTEAELLGDLKAEKLWGVLGCLNWQGKKGGGDLGFLASHLWAGGHQIGGRGVDKGLRILRLPRPGD